ncbi:MAG: lipopolysaccharide biosynthesis protein [Prevotellaceae bacterium]|nr:lipopolysaccharide biosynthesis protein [Prevotellaceae bacterium]
MANMKSLAKDTAIYGLSSIVGRFLNYLLVPLYTAKLSAASGGYGVITNMYAYTALILVLLTFGMETTFFRFSNKEGEEPQKVYSTILTAVGFTAVVFVALVFTFISPLADVMGYAEHPSYIWVMAMTVAIDAFQCIPFAYLRHKKKAIKFAALKMLFIVMNILLNIVFFVALPALYTSYPDEIGKIYDPTIGAGYAFYINLACTASITFCFYKELTGFRYVFDRELMKRMFSYSWPILILGIAGILNQTADKILFPYIYKGENAHEQLGIYGAASKIAMIMAMITQAFRYAYEPFVFGKSKDKDNRETYAKAMKFFIIFTLLAFLTVVGYLDILKHIIGQDYWSGLKVVPIVMAAEIMMGIYFNLSFWYKLIDKTIWGAWFSGIGCSVLIAINVIFVPQYGYMACAWAGFAGYATAMTLSYFVGQKYYLIKYDLAGIGKYVVLALICFALMKLGRDYISGLWVVVPNTLLILLFLAYIVKKDFPLTPILKKLKIKN